MGERGEKRGQDEGEGRKIEGEGKRGVLCTPSLRRRETKGWEGGGKKAGGERGLPPCPTPHLSVRVCLYGSHTFLVQKFSHMSQ